MFLGLFIDTMVINTQLEISDSELVWDIASSASATTTPNILSELSFRDIRSLGYVINLGYMNRFDNNIAFVLEAEYADSRIQSGRAQDSDYASDNRTDEFSRSFSDIESDSINYFSLATGIKTRWLNTKGHYLSFLIGYKKHNVDITMTNGVVEIPEADAGSLIPGLNSTYNSEFRSIFAGLSTEHVFSWGTIGFRYDLYYTDLKAEADWNLRTDFAHPVSFEQVGDGKGYAATLGYTYNHNRNWDYSIDYVVTKYHIQDGYDQTYFSDTTSFIVKLNNSEYKQEAIRIGVSYNF